MVSRFTFRQMMRSHLMVVLRAIGFGLVLTVWCALGTLGVLGILFGPLVLMQLVGGQ